MKKKSILVLLIVMLIVVAVFCYLITAGKTTPTVSAERLVSGSAPASPPSHARVRKANMLDIIQAAYNNPITLYGKVVDQNGEPVPGATIELYPLTSHFQEDAAKNIVLNTDAAGAFSIKGLRGFSMGVSVKKEGYLHISPLGGPSSSTTVSYGSGAVTGKRYSNPKTPLVLRLQNPGTREPMVCVERKRWSLPVNGTPRLIALDSKDGKGQHQIEFRFKSDWNKLPKTNAMYGKRYDWSFEARIPGGGFIWNDKDFDFTAPGKQFVWNTRRTCQENSGSEWSVASSS